MIYSCAWCCARVHNPTYHNYEKTIHFCGSECMLRYNQRKRKLEEQDACRTTKK